MSNKKYWPQGLPRILDIPETTLFDNLKVSASRYPDKPAVVFYDSVLTYGELLKQAEALAGYLQAECKVKPGDRVALYSQNCPQFVVGYYGILRAQGVVVPVNPMNLASELEYCVSDSGARTLLAAQELYKKAVTVLESGCLDRVIVHTYSDYLGDLSEEKTTPLPGNLTEPRNIPTRENVVGWGDALSSGLQPLPYTGTQSDVCLTAYTSGTTGNPKGCLHNHRTIMAAVAGTSAWRGNSPATTVLAIAPLFHVLGMQAGMNTPIFCGSTVVVMQRWDRQMALEFIERYRVTSWSGTPAMFVEFFANPALVDHDISSLHRLMGGGAAMPEAVSRRLNEEYGLTYNEAFGLTETAGFVLGNPVERGKRQCLGIATFNVDARIIDPATLEELPQGKTGEIILNGPQVMLEYWQKPEANEDAFIHRDGKRYLRTGDLAYLDEEGYFFMVDRLKRMINASGYKVWPAEVESIMYGHPDIQEACVISIPDEKRGETAKVLIVLKPEASTAITAEDIIDWCKQSMATYKVPTHVEFLDELPKSGAGKVLWRQLQDDARAKH